MPSLLIIDDAPVLVERVYFGNTASVASTVKTISGITLGAEDSRRVAVLLIDGISNSSTVTVNGHSLVARYGSSGSVADIWSGLIPTGNASVDLVVTLPANRNYITAALYVLRRCRSEVPVDGHSVGFLSSHSEDLTNVPVGAGMVASSFTGNNSATMTVGGTHLSSDGQVTQTVLGSVVDSGSGVAPSFLSAETITYTKTGGAGGGVGSAAAFR